MSISVLLVDDEERFIQTLAMRLTLRRMLVHTAYSGAEALQQLQEQSVDVVVVDVRMPGMDGIELTRTVRHDHPLVEVILLSGHANLEASAEGMELGAFDYLLKPVSIDELVYKIEDAHRKKALQEEKIQRLRTASAGAPEESG
jgi:YesN/AraC family two-component response regulator